MYSRQLSICFFRMSIVKSSSLTKNLVPLTHVPPKPVINWEMHERIRRNKECWDNPESIVHRLPKHYQQRYWKNFVMAKRTPIHYDPPKFRFYWDKDRLVKFEAEEYPVLPLHCPEQDQGLWGGEGVIKGYQESGPKIKKKILPRYWLPRLWFPNLIILVLYSEILDKYLKIIVTERISRLVDKHYGLDFYLLETDDIDINSKLGMDLKRKMLITLAKQNYHPTDTEKHEYVKAKYQQFVIPLEEAEWWGLDLNAACRKQQDLEDSAPSRPLKYKFEEELIDQLVGAGFSRKLPKEVEKEKEEEDWGEWEEDWKERAERYRKHRWIGWKG